MTFKLEKIRIGIPSKGRMLDETLLFFERCGLNIKRVNRRYLASLAEFPDLQIIFQRQEDIVKEVESGLLSFGIAGADLISELAINNPKEIIPIHKTLGFGKCKLEVAIPEYWNINSIQELSAMKKKFKVASKFPNLTTKFLKANNIEFDLVDAAGTLEISPALGNSDIIVDLVSTGATLADNRLKRIEGGEILSSQAVFVGNRSRLKDPRTLEIAKTLLEFFEATLRSEKFVSVHANMRGNPDDKIQEIFALENLSGLQGPTVSKVYSKQHSENGWFAVHFIADKSKLTSVISALRNVGGSGVVVVPTLYIFEEEPKEYVELLEALKEVKVLI
jgi:ATP phosphoribosyltransferase